MQFFNSNYTDCCIIFLELFFFVMLQEISDGGSQGDTGTDGTATDDGSNKHGTSGSGDRKAKTSPPETVFKKLSPSYNRYTLLRDEL